MGAKVKIISEPKAWVTSLIYRIPVKIGEMDVMKEEVTSFMNIGNIFLCSMPYLIFCWGDQFLLRSTLNADWPEMTQ